MWYRPSASDSGRSVPPTTITVAPSIGFPQMSTTLPSIIGDSVSQAERSSRSSDERIENLTSVAPRGRAPCTDYSASGSVNQ
jgi:hypothetical protein